MLPSSYIIGLENCQLKIKKNIAFINKKNLEIRLLKSVNENDSIINKV